VAASQRKVVVASEGETSFVMVGFAGREFVVMAAATFAVSFAAVFHTLVGSRVQALGVVWEPWKFQ
jgi:hypothetical protein